MSDVAVNDVTVSDVLLSVIQQSDTGNNGAGALAFVVVAALFLAGWFLFRSLRRQLRRIDFDEDASTTATEEQRADPDT